MLLHDTDNDRKSYTVSAIVAQSSVLGSILCDIMYDGVLIIRLPKYTQIIGFVDDIACIFILLDFCKVVLIIELVV